MKGMSIITGTLLALGLGVSPAAMANDDLDEVTVEFVFDDLEDVGGVPLTLEDDVAREERDERESDGEGDGSDETGGDDVGFDGDERVAELTVDELGVEHDEEGEGELEDHDVEEMEDEHDGEFGEDGLDGEEGMEGEDVAAELEIEEEIEIEMVEDEVASDSDLEELVEEDGFEEGGADGDLA